MKKAVVLMALALGLFACDDGKKDNGGGGNTGGGGNLSPVELGNLKIGETTPARTFVVKNILGAPAFSDYFSSYEFGLHYLDPTLFREETNCNLYLISGGEENGSLNLPVGATCNVTYTFTPHVFARYTVDFLNSSRPKDGASNYKMEIQTINFVASPDGRTEPPADISITIPATGGTVSKKIEINKTSNPQDYLFIDYSLAWMATGDQAVCQQYTDMDCYELPINTDNSAGKCVTSCDIGKCSVTVPPAGCDLELKFQIGTGIDKNFDKTNSFYLRNGNDPNTPVQRYVLKK